ncbi:hypothetical protein ACFXG4_40020 [Nocardia sp. NPDC059246]|uniref:hypothetical protein n=1 Tax=unclassified Nocardia TaxID=2637762 RepID=UPI00369657CF
MSITIAAAGETYSDISSLASRLMTPQQPGNALGLGVLDTVAMHRQTVPLVAGVSRGFALQLAYLISTGILTVAALLAVTVSAAARAQRN